MEPQEPFSIDIGKVLRAKFGPKTPRWIISLARRLIHEDYVNAFLRKGYKGVECAEKALEEMDVTLQVEGMDKVPAEGRFTVVSNHPLGGHDAMAIVALFGRRFDGNVRIMVNDFLMAIQPMRDIFVPVNKVGGQARDLAAQTDAIFRSDAQILHFPAGKCARRIDGKIQDPPWKKSFIVKSVETRRDIIPMHFIGRNSWRFHLLDKIGDLTGINRKFPLAMVLLVDEMYRARGRTYRIVIGDPVPWQTFDGSRSPAEWARWMKERVENL